MTEKHTPEVVLRIRIKSLPAAGEFDEFVKAGKSEASAAERAARAARIAAQHRRVEAWRVDARSETGPRPPGRRKARLTIAAAIVLVGLIARLLRKQTP